MARKDYVPTPENGPVLLKTGDNDERDLYDRWPGSAERNKWRSDSPTDQSGLYQNKTAGTGNTGDRLSGWRIPDGSWEMCNGQQ